MGYPFRCITDNPMLIDRSFTDLEHYEIGVLKLFRVVFQKVNCGYRPPAHPLTGSIRPDITPHKTVLLPGTVGIIGMESVAPTGKAIRYTGDLYRLGDTPVYKKWGKATREGFQLTDLPIIKWAPEVEETGR